MKVVRFEDLIFYQKSRELASQVYDITRQGEFKYDTRFIQQMRASAGSVSDNIAEVFEREGNKEFRNFLFIAKGSCGELRSQINRAYDVGFIDQTKYKQLYDDCLRLSISIRKLITTLNDSQFRGSKTI